MVTPKKTINKKPLTSNKKPTAKKTSTSGDQKESCFVIMPFGGWFDGYYTSIFAPAIKAAGLRPLRADDLYRPSTIVSDIWEYTREAKLILADLSGKNPNVFYELGIAHAIGRPVIMLTQTQDDNNIPFDVRHMRFIKYEYTVPGMVTFDETLRKSIIRIMNKQEDENSEK